MEILKCEHISKVYVKGNTCVKALDDVSFTVEKGEFVSIVGPSGSGKSTLLHILGGVDKPTEGKVMIDGTGTVRFYCRVFRTYRAKKESSKPVVRRTAAKSIHWACII